MLRRRVPSGPAPVLASDFQPARPQTEGALQQTSQPKPAAPLQQFAVNTHGQQPQHSTAAAPPPQIVKSAAPSAALDQQLKQGTESGVSPATTQGAAVPWYVADPALARPSMHDCILG